MDDFGYIFFGFMAVFMVIVFVFNIFFFRARAKAKKLKHEQKMQEEYQQHQMEMQEKQVDFSIEKQRAEMAPAYCRYCGAKHNQKDKFCTACGASL